MFWLILMFHKWLVVVFAPGGNVYREWFRMVDAKTIDIHVFSLCIQDSSTASTIKLYLIRASFQWLRADKLKQTNNG